MLEGFEVDGIEYDPYAPGVNHMPMFWLKDDQPGDTVRQSETWTYDTVVEGPPIGVLIAELGLEYD